MYSNSQKENYFWENSHLSWCKPVEGYNPIKRENVACLHGWSQCQGSNRLQWGQDFSNKGCAAKSNCLDCFHWQLCLIRCNRTRPVERDQERERGQQNSALEKISDCKRWLELTQGLIKWRLFSHTVTVAIMGKEFFINYSTAGKSIFCLRLTLFTICLKSYCLITTIINMLGFFPLLE